MNSDRFQIEISKTNLIELWKTPGVGCTMDPAKKFEGITVEQLIENVFLFFDVEVNVTKVV